jgi:hypothetical protein
MILSTAAGVGDHDVVRRLYFRDMSVCAGRHEYQPSREIARSSKPIRSQLGIVLQAGTSDAWVNANCDSGRRVAASSADRVGDTSAANTARKSAGLMYSFVSVHREPNGFASGRAMRTDGPSSAPRYFVVSATTDAALSP